MAGLHDNLGRPAVPPPTATPTPFKMPTSAIPSALNPLTPPTPEEQCYLDEIKTFPKTVLETRDPKQLPEKAMWFFRRLDFTELDNPHHGGVIMAGSMALGPFKCYSGIKPTSTDILKPLVHACKSLKVCPAMVWLDDPECAARMQFLLSSIKGIGASYYQPPSPEQHHKIAVEVVDFEKHWEKAQVQRDQKRAIASASLKKEVPKN